ncbi:hypothetical protein [Flavimaricola marinus]|uniref:Uncharacterized protein n=1 Tax=Flavimaricola marinus TaxID=1819565 RepID=A0A238LGB6_9RHOB|nr:hypothetical protein [Flavimaricola marinus]SMY08729.1 hypothetical protein LOM8899_02885 [Flavimaricola marinus]
MTRLILLLLMFSAVVIAVTSVMSLIKAPSPAPRQSKDSFMPASVKNIAYVLLIILMFGVVSGVIGGL